MPAPKTLLFLAVIFRLNENQRIETKWASCPQSKMSKTGLRSKKMRRLLFLAPIALSALLTACGEEKTAPSKAPATVTVMQVVTQETPAYSEFTAQTQSSQLVEIRTRVSGFLDKRTYKEGGLVKQGQTLFQIDRKPFEAQLAAARGELSAQQARHAVAQATLARVKPLADQNALSKKDLDDSIGNERTAAAAVEVARANVMTAELNLGYTTIKSPIDGLASFAKMQDGSYLNANGEDSQLTTVAALNPMRIIFSVSENQFLQYQDKVAKGIIKAPENDNYEVEIQLADGVVLPEKGKITFSDTSYAQGTGTMMLRAEVSNTTGRLLPGQFVRARLLGSTYPKGILLPQRAVLQNGDKYFVWLVDKDSKAQMRPIEVGNWMKDQWLNLSGLDGFMRLAPGVPVKVGTPPATTVKPEAAPPAASK
jgi:membrane fusion protein (multidrug efflux system)